MIRRGLLVNGNVQFGKFCSTVLTWQVRRSLKPSQRAEVGARGDVGRSGHHVCLPQQTGRVCVRVGASRKLTVVAGVWGRWC